MSESQIQNPGPAARMQQVAENMATKILGEMSGMQGTLLKPMLTNYLNLLTQTLTDAKAVEMCEMIRSTADYVISGPHDD